MKRWYVHIIIVVVLGMQATITPSVEASLLEGKQIRWEWLYPNNSTVLETQDLIIGPGIEKPDTPYSGVLFLLDLSDESISFTVGASYLGFGDTEYNGFHFFDFSNTIDPFYSVSINSATNLAGFSASRISFDADNIDISFTGLPVTTESLVLLDIATIPEPATLLLLGLGGLVLRGRKRTI